MLSNLLEEMSCTMLICFNCGGVVDRGFTRLSITNPLFFQDSRTIDPFNIAEENR